MTHAHTKAGGQAWEGRAARRPLGGSTRTQRGSPARRNLSQHAILQPAGHHGYRGVPTNQLLPCAPSSRRALRVEFSGSGFSPVAHCISSSGRTLLQVSQSEAADMLFRSGVPLRGELEITPAQPATERPERYAADAIRPEYANGSRE